MSFMMSCRMNSPYGCHIPGNGIKQMNEWAHEEQAERDVVRVVNDVAVCYLLISMANFANTFEKDHNE